MNIITEELNETFPVGVLIFPKDKVKSLNGDTLDWILFYRKKFNKIDDYIVTWLGYGYENDSKFMGYLPKNETELKQQIDNIDDPIKAELQLRVNSILFNFLLAAQQQPEIIPTEDKPIKSKGFSTVKTSPKNVIFQPNWITIETPTLPEKDPNEQITIPDVDNEETVLKSHHNSPITHLRKGHWKRVRVGKRGQQTYKMVFINPTIVGSKHAR